MVEGEDWEKEAQGGNGEKKANWAHAQNFPGGSRGKEPTCQSTGDVKDTGSVPGSGRSPRGGNGNPLQYSCLKNPMDREAYNPKGHKELDMTDQPNIHTYSCFTVLY